MYKDKNWRERKRSDRLSRLKVEDLIFKLRRKKGRALQAG